MTRPPRITPQDPSHSPTFNLSAAQTEHSVPASIRRNLFSAHLSRRPVSNTASAIFAPHSPTHQNAHSRHDVFSSGPSLHPTKRVMDAQDIYDPNASPPTRTASPSTIASTNLFPRESIVAVHPVTGRPLLPNLPTLPPRLRLSDDNDEGEDSEEEMNNQDYLDYGRGYSRSPSHARKFNPSADFDFDPDIDLDSSDLNFIGISRNQGVIGNFMDTMDSEESRRDRERIERLLADMMNQQRARARTLTSLESSTNMSKPGSVVRSASGASRATRGGRTRQRKADEPSIRFGTANSTSETGIGGVGVTMDPAEKDELMGLIMTSLRRKLQQAEDEGWMYGGADGLGGIGMGAEYGDDSAYE